MIVANGMFRRYESLCFEEEKKERQKDGLSFVLLVELSAEAGRYSKARMRFDSATADLPPPIGKHLFVYTYP